MTDGLGLGIDQLADVRLIGSGGFSVVYSARHTLFDRPVAVKVLTNVKSESDKKRFERECQVMGRLSGAPNVVTVFHADYTSQGQPYLIMELVEGGTLADRVGSEGPIPWQEAVDLLIPTSAALGYAHAEGILHRDIKPENILLDDGEPKLTDFGIAQLRDSTGTASTNIAASWLHAPPETFDNKRDERSDLYSLASTAHTIMTGAPPFWREDDETLHPLVNRLLNEPPPELPADVAPPELRSFLVRALAKDPAERPQTAGEFTAALAEMRGVSAPNPRETVAARGAQPTRHVGGLLAAPPGYDASPTTVDTPAVAGPTSTAETVAIAPGQHRSPTGQGAPAAHDAPPAIGAQPVASTAAPANGATTPPGGFAGQPPGVGEAPGSESEGSVLGSGWPDTGGRPHTADYRPVVYEEPRRRYGLVGALLLVLVLGGAAVFAWWSTRPDDGAAADSDVATAETPPDGSIPNLVGLTEGEAVDQLRTLGFEVGDITTRPSGTADEGVVVDQSPASGAEEGPVDLVVSSGPDGSDDEDATTPIVPDVEGLAEADAIARLDALGITGTVSSRDESTSVASGRVISQSPSAGTEAGRVTLTISTGPPESGGGGGGAGEPPVVPDVRGKAEAVAIAELDDLGIDATVGSREHSDTAAEGDVIDQSPAPGVASDSVTLVVSDGVPPPAVSIDSVSFSPSSPSTFEVGEQLAISIDYTSGHDGPIQIWARPTSGDYGASGSAEIDPGSGTHPQSFRLNSPGTVDQIRVFAVDADSDELLVERFYDVTYTWEQKMVATPTQLSPANGSVFDFFPRTTTLSWTAVDNAASYSVEIQFFSGGTWTTHGTSASGLNGTSYTFDFVGAQPGRWRVWAVDANGEASPRSGWWEFEYLR